MSEEKNSNAEPNGAPQRLGGDDDRVEYVSISTETRRRYLNYAMSVIMARALPDVRDGLKPVQRRILFVMFDGLRLTADAKHIKCQKIAGDTIGNYHPHGDGAAYEALVRLAQDFTLRYPLVDGWGNFGSVMGLPAAAARYTEARLTALAEQLMNELRFETVDERPNYDGTKNEPVVFPARFPHLLVNGSSGIAVGMATNIPPHNLGEVIKAAVHLIGEPEATVAQLMKYVKGPDFPLGGRIISDRKDIRTVYEEGRGAIKVRGEWKPDRERGKEVADRIVIHSVPYGVETNTLVAEIGNIVIGKKLPQLVDVSDQTNDENGLKIVLEIKPGADPEAVLAYLYKHTALEQNFAVNLTCLIPDEQGAMVPRRLNLAQILRHFLDFRLITVRRRFEHQLRVLQRRIHILEGFEIIFNGLDKALKIIRNSTGKSDAAAKLMQAFPLDAEQTDAVLELALYRISSLEIDTILEELREKRAEAARIQKILASTKLLWGVVEKELLELGEKFGDKRRSSLGSSEEVSEFDPNAYVIKENTNVVLTREGWLKRVGRLARVEGTRVREGDEVQAVIPGSTLDHVLFFSNDGVAYTLRIDQVPASSGYGEPLSKHVRMGDGVQIVTSFTTDARFTPPDFTVKGEPVPGPFFIVATAFGQVLRLPLSPFRTPSTKVGRKYVRLAEGDRVVFVGLMGLNSTMMIATQKARLIHFRVDEIPVLSGVGKGVRGIKTIEGDRAIGAALLAQPRDALRAITEKEAEEVFTQQSYDPVARGGKGYQVKKRATFVRVAPPPIEIADWAAIEAAGE